MMTMISSQDDHSGNAEFVTVRDEQLIETQVFFGTG